MTQKTEKAPKANDEAAEKSEPEKAEVKFEGTMPLEEAVSYFEALVSGMKKGTISLKQGETRISLEPPAFLDVGVKAVRKKDKEKISFEIAWRTSSDSELSISSQ